MIDISRYSPLFKSHLQVCVDRLMLPVASDMVDFMLSKNLAVEHSLLQTLLHKLGKQNIWLRAREVFRRKYRSLVYCLAHLWHRGKKWPKIRQLSFRLRLYTRSRWSYSWIRVRVNMAAHWIIHCLSSALAWRGCRLFFLDLK